MPKWYQSLYWRIGIGFVVFLAVVLALQGGALVFLISRMEVGPGATPPEATRFVARDLGEALTADPGFDIQAYLREEYGGRMPLVAIMKDGRTLSTDGTLPPDAGFGDLSSSVPGGRRPEGELPHARPDGDPGSLGSARRRSHPSLRRHRGLAGGAHLQDRHR